MVTMAQSAVNWRNTHTHMDRTHSFTHVHQHSYSHVVRSASSVSLDEADGTVLDTLKAVTVFLEVWIPGWSGPVTHKLSFYSLLGRTGGSYG